MRRSVLAVAVLAGLGWSASAGAVPITATYNFDAEFASGPYPTIAGSLTISYDTSDTVDDEQVTSFSSNLPLDYAPIDFAYDGINVTFGQHVQPNEFGLDDYQDNLGAEFGVSATGSVTGSYVLGYATTATEVSFANTFAVTEVPTVVPEPASFAVLGMGLIGLAAALRRSR